MMRRVWTPATRWAYSWSTSRPGIRRRSRLMGQRQRKQLAPHRRTVAQRTSRCGAGRGGRRARPVRGGLRRATRCEPSQLRGRAHPESSRQKTSTTASSRIRPGRRRRVTGAVSLSPRCWTGPTGVRSGAHQCQETWRVGARRIAGAAARAAMPSCHVVQDSDAPKMGACRSHRFWLRSWVS